jgi:hypothetical protein
LRRNGRTGGGERDPHTVLSEKLLCVGKFHIYLMEI